MTDMATLVPLTEFARDNGEDWAGIWAVTNPTQPPGRRQRPLSAKAWDRAAIQARAVLAGIGPVPLPITNPDMEDMKNPAGRTPREHMLLCMWSHFARSLAREQWDMGRHPAWSRYARAYLAQPHMRRLDGTGGAVIDVLLLVFGGPEPSPHLIDGSSMWCDPPRPPFNRPA